MGCLVDPPTLAGEDSDGSGDVAVELRVAGVARKSEPGWRLTGASVRPSPCLPAEGGGRNDPITNGVCLCPAHHRIVEAEAIGLETWH
jgi:hypothetical protein